METTGNSLAVDLTGAFWDVHALASGSLGPPDDLQATVNAHVAILDAIENGDPELLRDAIHAHYVPIRERMTGQLPRPA
jgi:DNA-binding FadR family transcriptional regulator